METKRYIPYIICLVLFGAAFFALSIDRKVYGNPEAPVDLSLPDRIDDYTGHDITYCQNPKCSIQMEVSELLEGGTCINCESEVGHISIGEKNLLPAGTPIFKRMYKSGGGRNITVSFVFSGVERRSIHKPQICLKAQGNTIRNETTETVEIPGREDPLDIRVLDIARPYKDQNGNNQQHLGLYSYWFFNPEVETCYHNIRLTRMASDNIFRSYRPRWAYVIVSTSRLYKDKEKDMQAIKDFIPYLMPPIEELREKMRQSARSE